RGRERSSAVTSAPAPRANAKTTRGTARVLDRRARTRVEREDPASAAPSGEGSSMGYAPTASATPAARHSAAKRRWAHRATTRPASPAKTRVKPTAISGADSWYARDAVVAAVTGSPT